MLSSSNEVHILHHLNKDYNVVDNYAFLEVLPFMLGPELKCIFHMGLGMGRSFMR